MKRIRKIFGEPSNIYESVSPFYYTLKFFGLASYDLNFYNGQMKTSWIHYIMMLWFCLVYSALIVNFLNTDAESYSPEGKSVLIYGLEFVYDFQYIVILLLLILNFIKRGNVGKLLKLLEKFDNHCEKMRWKYKVNHERNYWSSIFWIIFSIFSLSGVATIQMLWVGTNHVLTEYLDTFYYCIITSAFILSTFQFIFGVHSVASRFEILNKITKWLFPETYLNWIIQLFNLLVITY